MIPQMNWQLRTNNFIYSPLQAEIRFCTWDSLIGSGLKKLSLFWGLAIICIAIPVLHFFLVPAFLIAGIYSFHQHFQNSYLVIVGNYTCPSCEQLAVLKKFYFYPFKKLNCSQCSSQLSITPEPSLTDAYLRGLEQQATPAEDL